MDHKLTKQFTYVHQNVGNHRIGEAAIKELGARCGISVYETSVTITCNTLSELGKLATMCTGPEREGPGMFFCGAIGREIVKFIGG